MSHGGFGRPEDEAESARWEAGKHHPLFCPTGFGCMCACPDCITHCGPADREAHRFCVTQGIRPTGAAVRAARMLLDQREAQCVT